MASLERQLTDLGKRLAPRSVWVEGIRQSILTRGQVRRFYFGMGRFVFHMPMMFPRVSSTFGAIVMLVLGLSASVSAAKESLPGHRLYGLKRTMERVELKTASSETKTQVQFNQAERRLKEVGVLAVTAPNSPRIKESLAEFSTQFATSAKQIDNAQSTPAQREAVAHALVNKASDYARVLEVTKVMVAPPLRHDARQAKHLVNFSTLKAVETLAEATVQSGNNNVVDATLQNSIKDQVASLKIDAKEATALVQLGSTKKTVEETKIRVDLAAKANETIGTAEYLVEKGDYRQAAAKVRQTLEFMVKLDADQEKVAAEVAEPAVPELKTTPVLPATPVPVK